jgi:hypothetical protein
MHKKACKLLFRIRASRHFAAKPSTRDSKADLFNTCESQKSMAWRQYVVRFTDGMEVQ